MSPIRVTGLSAHPPHTIHVMDAEGTKDVPADEDALRKTIPDSMPFLMVVERLYELMGLEEPLSES